MFLKFQQLEHQLPIREGDGDSWTVGHHSAVVECDSYIVDKSTRTIICEKTGGRVYEQHFVPSEFWDVFVMNNKGQTVDTLEFKPVPGA